MKKIIFGKLLDSIQEGKIPIIYGWKINLKNNEGSGVKIKHLKRYLLKEKLIAHSDVIWIKF